MSKLNKIKALLQDLLVETFSQATTDSGILAWASDGNLPQIEEQVWGLGEDGSRIPLEDKDYVLSDGTVISVANGVVTAINTPDAEVETEPEAPENNEQNPENEEPTEAEPENEPAEEPVEEQPAEEPEAQPEPNEEPAPDETEAEPEQTEPERNLEEEVARLERENGELRERIAELENRIKELENESAGAPAEEEFKEIIKISKTGNKQLDNLSRIINAK